MNLLFSSLSNWNKALPTAKLFSSDMSWGFHYSQSSFQFKEFSLKSEKNAILRCVKYHMEIPSIEEII